MAGPTIAYNNLLAAYTALTPTDDEIGYPATNIFHSFQTKPWRSRYQSYTIDALCNKLNFNIDGVTEKTATLTSGDYRADELASEIATRMNIAAAVADITCTYNSTTKLFTIAKTAGTLQLLTASGTNKRTSVFPTLHYDCATNKTGALSYTATKESSSSGGTYLIDATNNKLYFNIGGAGLTATIAANTYSGGSLASEIKYQMDTQAGGDAVNLYHPDLAWTSNGVLLWDIERAGATLNLTCTTTTNAIWDVLGFSTAANRSGSAFYFADYRRIHTHAAVVIDMGVATNLTFVSVAGLNLNSAATGGTFFFRLQGNASDAWTAPTFAAAPTAQSIDSATDKGWAYWTLNQTFRYWRILIINNDNVDGFVQYGAVLGGLSSQLSHNYDLPAGHTRFAITEKQFTDAGGVYGEIKASFKEYNLTWGTNGTPTITQADKNIIDALHDANEDIEPFGILLDSTGLTMPVFMWAISISRPAFTEVVPSSTGSSYLMNWSIRESA